jgi:hypothetical protein
VRWRDRLDRRKWGGDTPPHWYRPRVVSGYCPPPKVGPVLAVKAVSAAGTLHASPALSGAHCAGPQHELTTQTLPAGHERSAAHGPTTPQLVEPGKQNPPPPESVKHTQSGFSVLQTASAPHWDPMHSGCGLIPLIASAGWDPKLIDAATTGAAYASFAPVVTMRRLVVAAFSCVASSSKDMVTPL